VECVPVGGTVTLTFSTRNGLDLAGGFWTNLANPERPGSGPVDPARDVEELEPQQGSGDNGGNGQEDDGGEEPQNDRGDQPDICTLWLLLLLLIILILLALLFRCYKRLRELQQGGDGNPPVLDGADDGEPSPFDDTIFELESKRDLLKRVKRGKTDAQKRKIDEAVEKINEAIDGLKKMRDGDPNAPSEGDIEKALRDAADLVEEANPGNRNPTLRRLTECLRDIAKNLF
jgi:hypothetical protein